MDVIDFLIKTYAKGRCYMRFDGIADIFLLFRGGPYQDIIVPESHDPLQPVSASSFRGPRKGLPVHTNRRVSSSLRPSFPQKKVDSGVQRPKGLRLFVVLRLKGGLTVCRISAIDDVLVFVGQGLFMFLRGSNDGFNQAGFILCDADHGLGQGG